MAHSTVFVLSRRRSSEPVQPLLSSSSAVLAWLLLWFREDESVVQEVFWSYRVVWQDSKEINHCSKRKISELISFCCSTKAKVVSQWRENRIWVDLLINNEQLDQPVGQRSKPFKFQVTWLEAQKIWSAKAALTDSLTILKKKHSTCDTWRRQNCATFPFLVINTQSNFLMETLID